MRISNASLIVGSCILTFLSLLSCALDETMPLVTGTRTLCGHCDSVFQETLDTSFVSESKIDSLKSDDLDSRLMSVTWVNSKMGYELVPTDTITCEACLAEIRREEEIEREQERKRAALQKLSAKYLEIRPWVEGVSVFPLDYLVHIEIHNKSNKRIAIEFEAECSNFSAPGVFFTSASSSCELSSYSTKHWQWHPESEISKLRAEFAKRGSDLESEDWLNLAEDKFNVEFELKSLRVLQ